MNDFLDINDQANGRSANFAGPTFYFLSKFSSIQMPRTIPNHQEHVKGSVVGDFNWSCVAAWLVKENTQMLHHIANWLKKNQPKHAIHLHQEGYCGTCAEPKGKIHAKQTAINCKMQSTEASPDDLKQLG